MHKHRPEALLLEDWSVRGDSAFRVRTRPGPPRGVRAPVTVVAEMLRQAVILISHEVFGVPASAACVMNDLSVDLRAAPGRDRVVPALDLDLRCADVVVRGGALRSMRVHMRARCASGVFATGGGDLGLLSAQGYRRVRRSAAPRDYRSTASRPCPELVGCVDARDVVLGDRHDDGWFLALDTGHPVLFDHPADHVPGMVLLEAAMQACAYARPGAAIRGVSSRFRRYVEFTPPAALRCVPSGADGCAVTFTQDGSEVASVELRTEHRAALLPTHQ